MSVDNGFNEYKDLLYSAKAVFMQQQANIKSAKTAQSSNYKQNLRKGITADVQD